MMYWNVWVHGIWVRVAEPENRRPPISIDDTLDGYKILGPAKRLSDLFGEGWDRTTSSGVPA